MAYAQCGCFTWLVAGVWEFKWQRDTPSISARAWFAFFTPLYSIQIQQVPEFRDLWDYLQLYDVFVCDKKAASVTLKTGAQFLFDFLAGKQREFIALGLGRDLANIRHWAGPNIGCTNPVPVHSIRSSHCWNRILRPSLWHLAMQIYRLRGARR